MSTSSSNNESAFKKALAAVKAPKNRRLVIGGAILVVLLALVVVNVVRGDGTGDEPEAGPSTPVQVTVSPTETESSEQPAEGSDTDSEGNGSDSTSEPNVVTEEVVPEDTEPADSGEEPELNPEDYLPGAPENRGGLPEEFPLVDSFVYTGMEEEPNRIIINGTVDDATEAILTLDANLLDHYSVDFRNADNARTSARYHIDGPKLPEGTQVLVKADGTMQVRVPQE